MSGFLGWLGIGGNSDEAVKRALQSADEAAKREKAALQKADEAVKREKAAQQKADEAEKGASEAKGKKNEAEKKAAEAEKRAAEQEARASEAERRERATKEVMKSLAKRCLKDVKELKELKGKTAKATAGSSGKLVVDVYFSRNCYPGIWELMVSLLPENDKRLLGIFEFNIIPLSEVPEKSQATSAFIIHLETGRWLMDITEATFKSVREKYPHLTVVVLKPVKEEKLPEVLDKSQPNHIFQLTVSRPGEKFVPDQTTQNAERAQTVVKALKDAHGDEISQRLNQGKSENSGDLESILQGIIDGGI